MESKLLKILFSPETKDIPNYAMEGTNANRDLKFKITVNTIKNIGGIKTVIKSTENKQSYKQFTMLLPCLTPRKLVALKCLKLSQGTNTTYVLC